MVTGIFSLGVYLYFIVVTGDWPYTQLALTYVTIAMGLLLVIFVQPPTPFWAGGEHLTHDRRPTLLAIGLFALLFVSPYVPILRDFFGLEPLRDPQDLLFIVVMTLLWMFTLHFTWKKRWIDRYLDLDLQRIATSG